MAVGVRLNAVVWEGLGGGWFEEAEGNSWELEEEGGGGNQGHGLGSAVAAVMSGGWVWWWWWWRWRGGGGSVLEGFWPCLAKDNNEICKHLKASW